MRYQKKYDKHKQYDTEVNKKLLETTTVPTLSMSKKNVLVLTVEIKKKAPPKKKKTHVKKKKPLMLEKQQKELKEHLPPPKLLDADDNTVTTNNNYTGDEPYLYHVQYKRKTPTSCLPLHWMDGIISHDKFEYMAQYLYIGRCQWRW